MGIRQLVEDAAFLAQHGRHLGALAHLMLAVAGSSRKAFPKGTKSIEKPNETMGDREAFTLFLGGRIRRLLFGAYGSAEYGRSGFCVDFKGKPYDIEYVLYKFCRCELVHEGELPEDIEFTPAENKGMQSQRQLSVSISLGDKMVLDHGWIDLLSQAVVHARCNGAEFGISYFDLVPKAGLAEAEIERAILEKYAITPGRFEILKEMVRFLSPEEIRKSDDAALNVLFLALLRAGQVSGGALTGLASRDLANRDGQLLPKGLAAIREVADFYVLVKA